MWSADRDSGEPLWSQVLDDLRRRLAAGEFAERFPTDLELTQTYDVSRHTAREAVRRLEDDGLVERTRGRGTFVRRTTIDQPLGAIYSLFRSIEDRGHEQRSTVRALELRRDEQAAAILDVGASDPLVFLERVRLIDGEPFAVDCSWLPASFAEPLLQVDFSRTSLYEELAARCGVGPDHGWERIAPELPSEEQRRLLLLEPTQPVFAIERLALAGDRPIEWRHSVVRGDRFAVVARWTGTGVDTVIESLD